MLSEEANFFLVNQEENEIITYDYPYEEDKITHASNLGMIG